MHTYMHTSTPIKDTCLFVVCRLFGSRFLSSHAALAASDTNACARTCTIMMYDQLCRYLYARAMSCVHVSDASYGRVQTAPESPSVCRGST